MQHQPTSDPARTPETWRKLPREFETCAAQLMALADPCRLRIAACLFSGPKNVSELVALTNTSIAKTSHHLRVLPRGRFGAVRQARQIRNLFASPQSHH